MRIFTIVIYLFLIILGVSFAALNASSIPVHFYFTTLTLPTSVLIIVTLGIGVLLGYFLFIAKYWRLKATHRKIKNQLLLMEKEIKNLRAIPLKDGV